jgi:hypothetical protein
MAVLYRRTKNADTWHYCPDCADWPTENYEEHDGAPMFGEICNECWVKQRQRAAKVKPTT